MGIAVRVRAGLPSHGYSGESEGGTYTTTSTTKENIDEYFNTNF